MKITSITSEMYRWKCTRPIANGRHIYPTEELGVVRIQTDEGITGIGYGNAAMVSRFESLLLSEDPLDTERLWYKMWVPKRVGRRGLSTQAISAIDIALWDIKAKRAGMPLYQLLGGARTSIPAYVAGGYYEEGKDLRGLQEEMLQYVAWGVKAVKMKVGALDVREDARRVEAVRRAVGEDVKLLVDANCAYSVPDALRFADRIRELDVYWFEEPVLPDDYAGMREITRHSSIPLAAGENEYTKYGFRDLMTGGNVRILNADALVVGGITEFMKVAAMAQAHHCLVAPHGRQIIHAHLQCAIHNALILEYYPERFDRVGDSIFQASLRLNPDGTVSPPNVPGHGFAPNDEALAPYRIM